MRQHIDSDKKGRFRKAELVVTDVDGCQTDGTVGIIGFPDGKTAEQYNFNVWDGIAVLECMRHDIPVLFISGRDSPSVRERARKLKAIFYPGVQDKVEVVEALIKDLGLGWSQVLFVGDDIQDLSLLRLVKKHRGIAAAPANAREEVKREVDYVSYAYGGAGAFREIVEQMLIAKGLWDSIINRERTLG